VVGEEEEEEEEERAARDMGWMERDEQSGEGEREERGTNAFFF